MNERYLFVYRLRQEVSLWCYFYNRSYRGACERGRASASVSYPGSEPLKLWMTDMHFIGSTLSPT